MQKNIFRTSSLFTGLFLAFIMMLWSGVSLAGVEAILTDDAYTSKDNNESVNNTG